MPVYKYQSKNKNRFYVKVNLNNKQYCKRGFKTKNEALVFEASLLKSSNNLTSKNHQVRDLIPLFCKIIKDKTKVTTAYWKIGVFERHIFKYFDDCKIKDITPLKLEVIADRINQFERFKDKKRLFAMIKEFLEFLMNYGVPRDLNMSMLYTPYQSFVEEIKFDYYTREEFNCFLNVIDNPKYKLLFLLLFDYGLRIGECLALRHKDITQTRVFIKASVANKTGSGRQLYVKPKTKSSIRDYPLLNSIKKAYKTYVKTLQSYSPEDYIFKGKSNDMTIGESPVRRAQKQYEIASGLRHIKLHEFRHSCATELINKGFSPEQVASWLGHSSSEITLKIYFHLFPSRKLEIANYYNDNEH